MRYTVTQLSTCIALCILLALLFFGIIMPAEAQFSISPSDVTVEVSPKIPGPNEDVDISISSFLVNLSSKEITWFVNNREVASGIGRRAIEITTGDIGTRTTVDAIIGIGKTTIKKTFSIIPGTVDLLWEASDSYTPPFYKGKALASKESELRITAIPFLQIPSGGRIADTNTVYTWSREYKNLPQLSGYARRSADIAHNILNSGEIVGVTASDRSGALVAERTIRVPIRDPELLFYTRNPQTGIKGPALSRTALLGNETINLVAEPYFFSDTSLRDVRIAWEMNDNPISIQNELHKNELTLRPQGEGGAAEITASITHAVKDFQEAAASLVIGFGNLEGNE